ncbi:phospholipase A1-Ibeta2, chloroplastic-like [Magnolia sinica]|uniref:phospholipase A1-Ibeta2, chloroplastic-like n=1 Tax=Magnolia sinica TaxID=86752 RepID=UPI002658F976|nr:phospholipase A1-Ibeta2, chloroplastic-like [Magnolia sinica]
MTQKKCLLSSHHDNPNAALYASPSNRFVTFLLIPELSRRIYASKLSHLHYQPFLSLSLSLSLSTSLTDPHLHYYPSLSLSPSLPTSLTESYLYCHPSLSFSLTHRITMQMGSTLTASSQPGFTLGRTSSIKCRGPSLKPRPKPPRMSTQMIKNSLSIAPAFNQFFTGEKLSESTRNHLANLEKLLEKKAPLSDPHTKDSLEMPQENRTRGVLDGLSLPRIWPGWKGADEMSPRNLNDLQRLLSKSPEYSPRNNIGDRWKEYHGSNDWAGLLDPLDENLRREVIRYGEFVQAAYRSFHEEPATSAEGVSTVHHVELPDRSYRVTKDLYATSSIGLPEWVDDVAPNLGWMTQRTSRIGYVAVCDDPREIARMGRRDIVIALRGTSTCLEWAENVRDVLVPIPADVGSSGTNPKVECGFWSLYKTGGPQTPSLSEAVVEEVQRLINLYKGEPLSITVIGHSLGAALSILAADELSTCSPHVPPIAVFSFGGPRVGNRRFADRVEKNGVKVLRIVNAQDVITRVPGVFASEQLDQKLRAGAGNVAGMLDMMDDMPWAYSHVGTELRVDSRSSPYLKPDADMACCHDMEAYLHLVDGFMGSDCPFRSNAKRSIVRLLHEQGSNVKKLYTRKALTLNLERVGALSPRCLPSPT